MKTKYILGLFLSVAMATTTYAQDENLVENSSFEGVKGKLKKLKQINKAESWFSPTSLRADLFSEDAAGTEIGVPGNIYGKEDAADGKNYAGIIAYSYRGASPRTYVFSQLKEKLEKGVRYCVSYKVSLSDLSKYAVNNLGAHLSKKPFEVEGKKDIVLGPKYTVVKVEDNRVFEKRYSWESMCSEFVAEGGEKFLTIGNFDETKETKFVKLRKKADFRGAQVPMAYYYIDDIVVKIVEEGVSCNCDEVDDKEIERVVYSSNRTSMDGFTEEEVVENSTVYFAYLNSTLTPEAKETLDGLAEAMIKNPELKLNVLGHITGDEELAARGEEMHLDLASRRIDAVTDYLSSHGISKDRFDKDIKNTSDPESTEGTLVGKAQNRRVGFETM